MKTTASRPLTAKEAAFVAARRQGHGVVESARRAGYGSPKAQGSVVGARPAVQAAIAEGRGASHLPASPDAASAPEDGPSTETPPQPAAFRCGSAEELLAAVVRGDIDAEVALRVSAAKTLIAFEARRKRSRLPPERTPVQQAQQDASAEERGRQDEWAQKAAEIRARIRSTAKE